MDRDKAAVLIALIFAAGAGLLYAHYAWGQCANPKLLHSYVSDEVWYVSAARNLAYLFGLRPRPCPGLCYTTLFYNNTIVMLASRPPGASVEYTAVAAYVNTCRLSGDYGATATRCCFTYPDNQDISKYLNLEHPPLAKYLLALVMHFLGDCPLYWRLPALILSTLGVASAVYLAALIAARHGLRGGLLAGAASLALVYVLLGRSSFSADSCFAILEPFTLGFGGLSLVAAAHGRRRLAYLLAAAAVATKYTGLVYLASILLWDRFRRGVRLRNFIEPLLIVAGFLVLVYAPLAVKLGVEKLVRETLSGLNWFMTSRPPGPAANTPLDWLVGGPSFTLSVEPRIVATPNPIVMSGGLIASLVLLIIAAAEPEAALLGGVEPLFLLLMTLVYLAGNHTLYSFYVAIAEPFAATSIMAVAGLLYDSALPRLLRESVSRLRGSPEARIFSRLAGPRGAPLAALLALAALNRWGPGPGAFNVTLASRLDHVLVLAASSSLALTAILWNRLDPLLVGAAVLASGGVLQGVALLMLAMGVGEAPWLGIVAPLVYPRLSSLPIAGWGLRALPAAAVYAAALLLGLAPRPGPVDAIAAIAAALYVSLAARPPGSVYALLAALDPAAGIAAASIEASRGNTLPAVLYAASYLAPQPLRTGLVLAGLPWSVVRDARVVWEALRSSPSGGEEGGGPGGHAREDEGIG